MLNERDVSEKFNNVWRNHFPLLTPSFIKAFNVNYVTRINETPIISSGNIRADLVAEVAFNLSRLVLTEKVNAKNYLSTASKIKELTQYTARTIWQDALKAEYSLLLNSAERKDILAICDNIVEFVKKKRKKKLVFYPKLNGYGIIPDLQGDLEIDDSLFEIKTVTRNFQSSDLKQLFIYLALQQVSAKEKWNYAGLYNPRKGTCCMFNIKKLIDVLSGGRTPNEAFEGLLNNLIRDVEIDSRF